MAPVVNRASFYGRTNRQICYGAEEMIAPDIDTQCGTRRQFGEKAMTANCEERNTIREAAKMAKPINFYCVAPRANAVFVMGDFNDWNERSHPMQRQVDGCWSLQINLPHGHHRYQFVIDGKPTLDPRATGVSNSQPGGQVSLISVS